MSLKRHWRRALPRALFVATSLTATPGGSLPGADRRRSWPGAAGQPALRVRRDAAAAVPGPVGRARRPTMPAAPDGVVLFARPDEPFLVAFGHAGCLLALLPSHRRPLARPARHLGQIA